MCGMFVNVGYNDDEFLLVIDICVIIFVNIVVVMGVIVDDVIYFWIILFFGVKQDVVSGCLVQFWFKVEKEGIFFGQCFEFCGKDYVYMLIIVEVVF